MAVETTYGTLKSDCVRRLNSGQAVVEARLPSPGVMIAKILSIACDSVISGAEVLDGEVRYNGRVNFKVLFLDVDGVNGSMEYAADFSDKIADARLTPTSKPVLSGEVLDTDTVSVSASEIKLAAVVEVKMYCPTSDEIKPAENAGEDVYMRTEKAEYSALSGECASDFVQLSEFDPKVKIEKILLTECGAALKSASAGAGVVKISGVAAVCVCCEVNGGMIKNFNHRVEIEQELPCGGVEPEHKVFVDLRIKNANAVLEALGDGSSLIKCELTLSVSARAFAVKEAEVACDAFSVSREINLTRETVEFIKYVDAACFEDRVEGSVTLEADMPPADNVQCVSGARLNVANAYALKDKIVLEGVVSASVIYYNADMNGKSSVSVELPYSLSVNCSGCDEGDKIAAKGAVASVSASVRRGNEINITAEAFFTAERFVEYSVDYVKEIVTGEPRKTSSGAFGVHVAAPGETLWETAKALNATPELIMQQNPNLKLPLEGGERVIIYRHLAIALE